MSVHVVCTESLHTEVVNETIFLDTFYLISYLLVVYLNRDESQRNRKPISLKLT